MQPNDDWSSLVNEAFILEETPKCGEFPTFSPTQNHKVGSKESSIDAGSRGISPKSPHSPQKNIGEGVNDNLTTRAGELDGKFFCDQYRGIGALVNLKVAPTKGVECGQCDHLIMVKFGRTSDRRLFHWRCNKHFEILEAAYAGERIHIAPPECDQYQNS